MLSFLVVIVYGNFIIWFVFIKLIKLRILIGIFMMGIKYFLFNFEKLYKYVYNIFCVFNIYGDLYSFMFM